MKISRGKDTEIVTTNEKCVTINTDRTLEGHFTILARRKISNDLKKTSLVTQSNEGRLLYMKTAGANSFQTIFSH